MNTRAWIGGATAASVVGASFPVSEALVDYPLATGQMIRYAAGALILAALLKGRLGRPTLKELGYPVVKGDPFGAMFSLWAPKGTPKETIATIYRAFKRVVDENRQEIAKGLQNVELNLDFLGPDETAEVVNEEYALVKKMLDEMGVEPK